MRSLLIPRLASFWSRAELQAEVAAMRHQLEVFQRSVAVQPRLFPSDRIFWIWLSR